MSFKFYDIHTDEMRDLTQEDLDGLLQCRQAFGVLREGLKTLFNDSLEVAQRKPMMVESSSMIGDDSTGHV